MVWWTAQGSLFWSIMRNGNDVLRRQGRCPFTGPNLVNVPAAIGTTTTTSYDSLEDAQAFVHHQITDKLASNTQM